MTQYDPQLGDVVRRPVLLAALLVVGALLGSTQTSHVARAHEGPPFPILMDETVGPYSVSVWTDPDIGTGTFFVVLEPLDGEVLPDVRSVHVSVAPTSGRLAEQRYAAEPQAVRYGARYFAEVEFDRGEFWDVRVSIDGAEGGGELESQVEATPDGSLGPIELAIYLVPFLLVGGLWLKAMLSRRKMRAQSS